MSKASPSPLTALAVIAVVVAGTAGAFAWTAGWLGPDRLTPEKLVDALAPPTGAAPGFRRNHAKGVCFTGVFEANGEGARLSTAPMLVAGGHRVVGRLNLGTNDPTASDATGRVRGVGVLISADGQEWRSAMINAPVFPVSTPDAFHELLLASAKKDPDAMKAFAGAHPEIAGFGAWAGSAPWTPSYAETGFNGLNSFVFTDAGGVSRTVRWSLVPVGTPTSVAPDELAKRDPDFLEQDIAARVAAGPVAWKMMVTVAAPRDPTADPSKAWPADRETVEVGRLIAETIEPEPDGPCRDVNFDPTILPDGISVSDDPFPAARSAAYAVSFDRRSAEYAAYPGGKP